jgi:lipooligosaccharide transport system permease protein
LSLVASRRLWRVSWRSTHIVERNLMAYRHQWMLILSGFVEPVLYLLGIGFGIGSLVRNISLGGGHYVSYAMFVAPALMASSAMNGAIYESTFNLFGKIRYGGTFQAILATPLGVEDATFGEVIWAVFRGSLYSIGFVVLMALLGLCGSPLAILSVPAAILIGFAFAAVGSAATTFVRSWADFDIVQLILQPMFLFSGTFFPISVYPVPVRVIIELTPLYHGVDLIRGLTTGSVGAAQLWDVVYLVALALLGVGVAALRLRRRLLK